MENYGIARQYTDDNYKMRHSLCMLNDKGYRQGFRIFNSCCFSTLKMVKRRSSVLRYAYIASLAYINYTVKSVKVKDAL